MTLAPEPVATRLLSSTARHSYDPEVDIDWDRAFVDEAWFMPPERMSLYGTPLWDRLTEVQRRELSKHEVASIVHMGWWFEVLLMQGLLREVYAADPRSARTHYALAEVADECRHSTMFGRVLDVGGTPLYGPPKRLQRLGKLFSLLVRGPSLYAGALIVEETQDRWQREAMNDPRMQPLTRMVNRIHVLEEARHVTFARDELTKVMPTLSRKELAWHQALTAQTAFTAMRCLVHPGVYAAVGIDPAQGRRTALSNPHYRATIAWSGEKVMPFLEQQGLIGERHVKYWRASFLLAKDAA